MNALSIFLGISDEQKNTLLYLIVGAVGLQAVYKASVPANRLRVFLCSTMTVGFFAAVFLFHTILQTALPTSFTLILFAVFAVLSFAIERLAALIINKFTTE